MRRALVLLLVVCAALPAAASARPSLPDIEDEVMCVTCGTALNVSNAPSADEMRVLIGDLIEQGLTKQEIKDELVVEYGRNVLGTPPASGRDLAAWVVPGLLAVLALTAVVLTARRWRSADDLEAAPANDLNDADAERLEQDMKDYQL